MPAASPSATPTLKKSPLQERTERRKRYCRAVSDTNRQAALIVNQTID
ncbi:protein of unknown function [Shinella sp. WSC3-e]|nr:hypothetical protein SHINE37_43409 [Rhizobiaceae bacterium]CAK7257951.1 protein of unknown function [Shinella sp. WSC3-e]